MLHASGWANQQQQPWGQQQAWAPAAPEWPGAAHRLGTGPQAAAAAPGWAQPAPPQRQPRQPPAPPQPPANISWAWPGHPLSRAAQEAALVNGGATTGAPQWPGLYGSGRGALGGGQKARGAGSAAAEASAARVSALRTLNRRITCASTVEVREGGREGDSWKPGRHCLWHSWQGRLSERGAQAEPQRGAPPLQPSPVPATHHFPQAAVLQELVLAATDGWQQLDSINLTSAFHRLAQLAEAAPSGATAARKELQACGPGLWAWLLDCLAAAAQQDRQFGPRCAANALWALHKLDALDCRMLGALHPPLARALAATAAAAGGPHDCLSARGLSQVLWVLGSEAATQPLLLALKPQLLQALWAAAPSLDGQVGACTCGGVLQPAGVRYACGSLLPRQPGCLFAWEFSPRPAHPNMTRMHSPPSLPPSRNWPQGVATAWHALGAISARSAPEEAQLGSDAPELLPRLVAAARAVAPGMNFQGLAEVRWECLVGRGVAVSTPCGRVSTVFFRKADAAAACRTGGATLLLTGAACMHQDAAAALP